MKTEPKLPHPFENVDLARLDNEFPMLLEQASREDIALKEDVGDAGQLTRRERRLFQFGMMVGHSEWELAAGFIEGLRSENMAVQAFLEAALIRGNLVLTRLGPAFKASGFLVPANMPEVIKILQAPSGTSSGLSNRESFALGLGITWGAKCWDT
jgi:hypothetical protein